MMNEVIVDSELVARMIFPPQMVDEGEVLPAAFILRPSINEEYLSVLRISVDTFNRDMKRILFGRKRSFYGFAVMNVSEIHAIRLKEGNSSLTCNVRVVDNEQLKSHAGIFIILDGKAVTGAMSFEQLGYGNVQSHLLLAIRFRLAEIANNGLVSF